MFPGFTLFGRFISMYAVMGIVGIFAAFPLAIHWYKKRTGDDISMIFVLLFSAIGGFIGMHLLYGITNISRWGELTQATGFIDFLNRFLNIFGGSVYFGGLIGGVTAGLISVKVQKLPVDTVTDCVAPAIPLFHGFARIGCFLGGCCYGVESEFGFVYEHSLMPEADGVRRFPVQLAESVFNFALFFVLWTLLRKNKFKGKLLLLYLMIYSAGRFTIEFWRGDTIRGFIFGLSTSQFIGIIVFTVSAVLLIIKQFRKKNA